MSNTLEMFEIIAESMRKKFEFYLWGEEGEGYWIGGDCSGTYCFQEQDFYFSLSDMYDVLKNKYDPKAVLAHYDYSVYYSGESREYYINLKGFSQIWKGEDVKDFAKKYHKERDENTMFWKSNQGKQKEREIIEKASEPFIKYFKKNN